MTKEQEKIFLNSRCPVNSFMQVRFGKEDDDGEIVYVDGLPEFFLTGWYIPIRYEHHPLSVVRLTAPRAVIKVIASASVGSDQRKVS